MMGKLRWRGAWLIAGAALGVTMMVAGSACAPNQTTEDGPVAADTARGIVEIAGAEPITHVRLRTPDRLVTITGPDADQLRLAQGVEVWVSGVREEAGQLRLEVYEVRAVDGMTATDGVLELDGDAAVLVTRTGERVRFSPAPPGLRQLEGRRVWVAAPPGAEPRSWGPLERDR